MRLNLGSGEHPADGWVNVDAVVRAKTDLVADVTALPFGAGSVARIYAGHLIEHLYPDEAAQAIGHWLRLLEPGGELGIVVPDIQRMARYYDQGGFSKKLIIEAIGGWRDPADLYALHVSVYSLPQLRWFVESLVDGRRVADLDLEDWPAVSKVDWQIGLVVRA